MSVIKSRVQLQIYDRPAAAVSCLAECGCEHQHLHFVQLWGTLQADGIRGLYVGLRATMVLDVVYAGVQFAILEQARRIGVW